MPEPILIDCEGAGWLAHRTPILGLGVCVMCGKTVRTPNGGVAASHQREDLIAMIERGDFNA
jgi:hypothetical protein